MPMGLIILMQQRVRIDNDFSTWNDIKDGVPQRSILDPLFFNIHMCDLFYIMRKWPIANAQMTLHPTLVVKILNFTWKLCVSFIQMV